MMMVSFYFVLLFFSPQLWLYPFVGLPVDYIIYPLWLCVIIFRGKLAEFFRLNSMDWFVAAMVLWFILTAAIHWAANLTDTFIDYTRIFVLYRFIVVSLPTVSDVRKAMWFALFCIMILVVEGIQHKLSQDGIGWAGQSLGWVDPGVLAAGGTGRTRWVSIFDGPGVFCVVYTLGLPIVLMLFGKPFGKVAKFLGCVLLPPLLLATYFTGSRGGFLATLGVIALYLMFRWRVSLLKIGIVSTIVATAYLIAPTNLTEIKDKSNSAQNRVDMWREGYEMVQQNPVFGIGRGNFRFYTSKLVAHNSAIEVMGETGIPGLFLWVSLHYLAFKGLLMYRVGSYDERDKAYALALFLMLVGYLISSMFVTLEYGTLYVVFGLCAAMNARLNQPLRLSAVDAMVTLGICLAFVAGIKLVVILY